jgi:hypothetical protein
LTVVLSASLFLHFVGATVAFFEHKSQGIVHRRLGFHAEKSKRYAITGLPMWSPTIVLPHLDEA